MNKIKGIYDFVTKTYTRKLLTQIIVATIAFLTSCFSQDIDVYAASIPVRGALMLLGIVFFIGGGILAVTLVFLTIEYFHHIYTVFTIKRRRRIASESSTNDNVQLGAYDVSYLGPRVLSIFILGITLSISLFAIMLTELMGISLFFEALGFGSDFYSLDSY